MSTNLTVATELSPDMYVVLAALCDFYNKDRREVIEMALEHLAADAKLITRTIEATDKHKQTRAGV